MKVVPFRHGGRRPAIHDFASGNRENRGWRAFARHDEEDACWDPNEQYARPDTSE
jgi:hypothetical protein